MDLDETFCLEIEEFFATPSKEKAKLTNNEESAPNGLEELDALALKNGSGTIGCSNSESATPSFDNSSASARYVLRPNRTNRAFDIKPKTKVKTKKRNKNGQTKNVVTVPQNNPGGIKEVTAMMEDIKTNFLQRLIKKKQEIEEKRNEEANMNAPNVGVASFELSEVERMRNMMTLLDISQHYKQRINHVD